jgi:N-acetylneuraminate lyase
MNIINGPDEMLLMGLNAGADGGIGTTYNIMPQLFLKVYRAFRAGDVATATATQREIAKRVTAIMSKYPTLPATKAIMEGMGYAVGHATFPMKRLTDAERADLYSIVTAAGIKLEKCAN